MGRWLADVKGPPDVYVPTLAVWKVASAGSKAADGGSPSLAGEEGRD